MYPLENDRTVDCEHSYDSTIEALFSRHPSFQNVGKSAYKPGLDNMLIMDGLLGHPHRKYHCVHIAGTNGKGSVSNMIAAGLNAQGLKVGLFTSPHILDFRERMRVIENGEHLLISKEEVLSFIQKWQDSFDHIGMSFFEITTAMALDWFAKMEVDFAVIECGLGGRLDSTNIIQPVLSVITNIGKDHCDLLGESLGEIAFEKAGIIKPLTPVVIGEGGEEIDAVFERKVLYTNLPEPSLGGDRNRIFALLHRAEKQRAETAIFQQLQLGQAAILAQCDLRGSYQKKNLQTALCALDILKIFCDKEGLVKEDGQTLEESKEKIQNALIHTAEICGFHGRWERVCEKPEIICDIGHNSHGLAHNFESLKSLIEQGRKLFLIYGSASDKDVEDSGLLLPQDCTLILTEASSQRAMKAEQILEKIGARDNCHIIPEITQAIDFARASAQENDLIYIGGSTYVVSDAIKYFINQGIYRNFAD